MCDSPSPLFLYRQTEVDTKGWFILPLKYFKLVCATVLVINGFILNRKLTCHSAKYMHASNLSSLGLSSQMSLWAKVQFTAWQLKRHMWMRPELPAGTNTICRMHWDAVNTSDWMGQRMHNTLVCVWTYFLTLKSKCWLHSIYVPCTDAFWRA